MDSNLVQLGAYVIIILIIGGASVIKKIIEARKRRQEMEKHQVKTLSLEPTYSREAEEQTTSRAEDVEREIITESETDSSGGKPKIEDILKELFNIPTMPQRRSTTIKNIPRKQEAKAQPIENPQMVSAAVDEGVPAHLEAESQTTESNWEIFATGLKNRELTEIQRAIVMSELIQKPKSRRRV